MQLRTLAALTTFMIVPAVIQAQQGQPVIDLKKIWTPSDSINGKRVLDSLPTLINCPRFDPQDVRGDESTFSFESGPELERLPSNVQAEIEIVVKKDGKIDRRQTKVVRSTDYRLDRSLEFWVRRCVFQPGLIGEHAVDVRMVRKFEIEIPRY